MNKKQKEVELAKLRDEKKVLAALKKQYEEAAKDVQAKIHIIDNKMQIDMGLDEWDDLDEEKRSIIQSKIYQKKFQQQLKAQIDETVNKLNAGQYDSIEAYLNDTYTTAATGTAYDLHDQGVPLITPIDKKAMLKSVELDPKLSNKLYGSYMEQMKTNIRAEVSRGIATADSYEHIARNISNRTNQSFNKTMRIVRTEGHRIQIEAAYEQQQKAKKAGADIVKQWDATLDGRTRKSHRKLDGQIRELDEPFEVNGHKAMHPAAFGRPEEDINCRCALLQRAKWALDDEELETLKKRAEHFGLDKTESFKNFQEKYLKALEKSGGSGTIADINNKYGFNVISGDHSFEDDVKAVNPNFSTGREFQNNCGYCSVAYELRRRGYDVEANPKMGLYVTEWQAMFAGFKPVSVKAKRKDGAVKEMKHEISQWGDGARGSVFVVWDGRTWGHFFSVEVVNGEVRFVDPQNGNANVEEYFKRVKPSSILYGRVDDLDLTDNVKAASKNK